jgi:hypothetical protein
MRKPRKVYKYFDFAPDNSELKKRECNGSLECLSIDRANSIKALRGLMYGPANLPVLTILLTA